MSTSLTVQNIGVVGRSPRIVLCSTDAIESEVFAAGFINNVQSSSSVTVNPDDEVHIYFNPNQLAICQPIFGSGGVITLVSIAGSDSGNITGAINLGTGEGVFAQTVAPNLEFKSLIAGSGIELTPTDDDITISATGGGSFEYENTFWVAQNGNDANDGKSIDTPKLTIAGAIAAFTTPTTPSLINIVDDGLYTINHTTVSSQRFGIIGKGASLQSITADTPCFDVVTASSVYLELSFLQNNVSGDVLTLSGGSVQVDALTILGNVSGNGTFRGYFDNFTGAGTLTGGNFQIVANVWNGGYTSSAGTLQLTANSFNGPCNLSGTANVIGNVATTGFGFVVSNTGSGNVLGTFGNFSASQYYGASINLNDQFLSQKLDWTVPVTGAFMPAVNQSNALFLYNASANAVCTLPTYSSDPNYPVGFNISVCQQQAGNVQFLSGDPIESVQNRDWTEGRGAIVTATIMAIAINPSSGMLAYYWSLSGQIAGSAVTGSGAFVYVSQLTGSDTTGIGSIGAPYATISAALTAIGSPTNKTTIILLDDQTYNETITFNYTSISIIGTDATLNCSTGDTIVVATALPGTIYINVGTLASSGGNSINMNGEDGGSANLIVDAGFINAGPVVTTSTYACFLRTAKISANLNTSAGGSINYVTSSYTGTDSGTTVLGISPTGTEGTFKIGANTFAKTDSTAGYVWTTNGSGSSSLQPPVGGITWNGVSGTTQTAAVNNGYIIQNASATTISLPATAPIGSIVYVQGLGAGGWILGAHAGQTIQVGDVATSSGGSVSSANQWDAIGVVCVVANTTWAMLPPVTSGFSIF